MPFRSIFRLIQQIGITLLKDSSLVEPPLNADVPLNKDLKPWWHHQTDPLEYLKEDWNQTEIRLVRKIWDRECDAIVRKLADQYAWEFGLFVSEAVQEYLSKKRPEALTDFKQACEQHQTHVWYNIFMYYGQARAVQMGVRIREPLLLNCAGCGRRFREWSIPFSVAKKVGFKRRFCRDCYDKAFSNFGPGAASNKEDMLKLLADLAAALESVPTAHFVQFPDLKAVSIEKQIKVVRALIKLPSYDSYKKSFGSWLKALILANVLEDGQCTSTFGVHCIANDGHECFSLSEKTIDDWLSKYNIPHDKEPFYPYHAVLNPSTKMRADWKVDGHFIEYAGLIDRPEYATKMKIKQKIASESGLN
jgi:hypothetical protein